LTIKLADIEMLTLIEFLLDTDKLDDESKLKRIREIMDEGWKE